MELIQSQLSRIIPIVYEDDCCIAFNKPSGLLVIPTPKRESHTLVDIVNQAILPLQLSYRLHPCHRLDRDTSGIILFAKGKRNQKLLMDEFHKQMVKKQYIALVHGRLKHPKGTIQSPVLDVDQRKFSRNAHPKRALTYYRLMASKKFYSVLEVSPQTGRTNQIRIHFSQIGHPLVGERKYAFAKDFALKFKRTALHASALQWFHPVTKKMIRLEIPLANDMRDFIARHYRKTGFDEYNRDVIC
ncbi:MAG: RluA family pseudouridine synthase [Candidatus Omnitrophota bacterium]